MAEESLISMQANAPDGRRPLAITCVADSKPKYLFEALRLAQATFLNPRYRAFADLFIGVFADAPAEYVSEYRALGANVITLERYTERHGPSNKLVILNSPLLDSYDYVALFDCDLLPVEPFDELLDFDGVQAKLADLSTLQETFLSDVFGLFGMEVPSRRWRTSIDNVATTCYCNAGCIIFSKSVFRPFVREWFEINDVLLANMDVLRRRSFFLDQASFCVCLSKFLPRFRPLPPYINFPGHLPARLYSTDSLNTVPKIIHYHDRVDEHTGALDLTELPNVQEVIFRFNESTAAWRAGVQGRPLFWDAAHALLSRSGRRKSRDAGAAALVRSAVSNLGCLSILDLGCGIFCAAGLKASIEYRGVDFSPEAIRLCRQLHPQYSYEIADIRDLPNDEHGDLVLLLDVLSSRENAAAEFILRQAIARAGKAILVSIETGEVDRVESEGCGLARLGAAGGGFRPVGHVGSEQFFLYVKDEAQYEKYLSDRTVRI